MSFELRNVTELEDRSQKLGQVALQIETKKLY